MTFEGEDMELERGLVEASQILEQTFESRGLKFTTSFEGFIPVQAYGYLDGMRFYFRFRGNSGSLTLGLYSLAAEEAYVQEVNERRARRALAGHLYFKEEIQREEDPRYYPREPLQRATLDDFIPGAQYAGVLDGEQAIRLFSYLATHLTTL